MFVSTPDNYPQFSSGVHEDTIEAVPSLLDGCPKQ